MESIVISEAAQIYQEVGAVAFMVLFLVILVVFLIRQNESIRNEHRAERMKLHQESKESQEKMIEVVEKNATVMTELTTIIKNK